MLAGEIAPDAIRNRIVVVGSTVTGGGDFFPTPFDPLMPGVEVISTAIAHLMAGDGILRDRSVRIADGIVAVVLPMVLVGLLAWRRSAVGLIAAARRRSDLGGGDFLRVLVGDLVERGCAGRGRRAACDFVRGRSTLVGQAAGAVFRHEK